MSKTNDIKALTVSELTGRIKNKLEQSFPGLWVEGEISNLTRHGSGHWYFTLKDDKAQISAVMFRYANAKVRFKPEAGMKVLVFADVSVYPPRGSYQLKVQRMQPVGMGDLQLAFEQLKAKLEAEGLFSDQRKKPIPFLPKRVGVVTSPTGAAIRDIINVLTRRFPNIELILCPVRVQGDKAKDEIADAIGRMNELGLCDVLIVGRGGGSLEDLWAFNEEVVARAVFASTIPVISAVGHEVDFTISDFVADLRAPTPSAAAELAVPEKETLIRNIADTRLRLARALTTRLGKVKQAFTAGLLDRLFRRPVEMVELASQRLDDLTDRLLRAQKHLFELKKQQVLTFIGKINMLNPIDTLRRGFAIAARPGSGIPIRSVADISPGDTIDVRVSDGRLRCRVVASTREDENGQGKIF